MLKSFKVMNIMKLEKWWNLLKCKSKIDFKKNFLTHLQRHLSGEIDEVTENVEFIDEKSMVKELLDWFFSGFSAVDLSNKS